jgi:hypothetical protein
MAVIASVGSHGFVLTLFSALAFGHTAAGSFSFNRVECLHQLLSAVVATLFAAYYVEHLSPSAFGIGFHYGGLRMLFAVLDCAGLLHWKSRIVLLGTVRIEWTAWQRCRTIFSHAGMLIVAAAVESCFFAAIPSG